jgi:Skp family chaperone for outer membrane proteins
MIAHFRSGMAVLAAAFLLVPPAAAQQTPGWFVPNQAPAGNARPAAPRPRPAGPSQSLAPVPVAPSPLSAPPGGEQADLAPIDVPLPPAPEIPPLPKGAAPPGAIVGVLGVPEVMHASTAAQAVERTIGERREKLSADAQKEQLAWRDLQQALVNQRATLKDDQIRARERELQDRITNAQKSFRDRNTLIQQAAQYSLGQIERTLIVVIRQVAESRGMNLVLHRSQVALNVNDFDITQAVADELNKVLPSVLIPADGITLADWAKTQNLPTTAPKPAATQVSGAAPVAPKQP